MKKIQRNINMKNFDLKLFQLLFLLLPIALIKGINYPNIITTLIVVYFLFKNYSQILDIPFYFKVFFAFFIYLIFISIIKVFFYSFCFIKIDEEIFIFIFNVIEVYRFRNNF